MQTKHFKPSEFWCPCCGRGEASIELLLVMEDLRRHFGVPFTPNSACRCDLYHAEIYHKLSIEAGKLITPPKKSDHLIIDEFGREILCKGADISIPGISPDDVYEYLTSCSYSNLLALGRYKTFTHVGVRGVCARWRGK